MKKVIILIGVIIIFFAYLFVSHFYQKRISQSKMNYCSRKEINKKSKGIIKEKNNRTNFNNFQYKNKVLKKIKIYQSISKKRNFIAYLKENKKIEHYLKVKEKRYIKDFFIKNVITAKDVKK